MPGLGIWKMHGRSGEATPGPSTAPVMKVIPEPGKLDQTRIPFAITGSNVVCRIFGRNNTNNVLEVRVKLNGIFMTEVVFLGQASIGTPFAGIWTLFNVAPREDGLLEIFCGRDRAGCAFVRAGSLDGELSLYGLDYEDGLSVEYPLGEGNLLLSAGGVINVEAHPITSDTLNVSWAEQIPHHPNHPPGAAACFGNAVEGEVFTMIPAVEGITADSVIVIAEWGGVPLRNREAV